MAAAGKADVLEYLVGGDVDVFHAVVAQNATRVAAPPVAGPGCLERTLRERRNHAESLPDDWKTPLAVAVFRASLDMVRLLLDCGASVSVSDSKGTSLIQLAESESTIEIQSLLRALG